MPRPGEEYRAGVQLDPPEIGLFPQAILLDNTGSPLPESPQDMTHAEDGIYQTAALSYPNIPFVRASIRIYLDAAHLIESEFESAAQCFEKFPDPVTTQIVFAASLEMDVGADDEVTMNLLPLETVQNVESVCVIKMDVVSVLETDIDVSIIEVEC